MTPHDVAPADPFELPDWVGVAEVTWEATGSLGGHLVAGELRGRGASLPCDVLAGDLAHPVPVLADTWRTAAHLAWSLGEALLVTCDARLTVVVPGRAVDVEAVLEAVRRVARAVGAPSHRFTVAFRL